MTTRAADAGKPGLPAIEFDENRFDFGRVDQGQEMSHEFSLRNKGTVGLVLQDVISSCGCAAALPDRKEILPGERAKITVTLRSGGLTSPIEKTVTVLSNDPNRPAVTLVIRADVQPAYLIQPPVLNIGDIPRGQGAVRDITVRDAKGRQFKINGVTVSHKDLRVEVLPLESSNGSGYRLRASVNPKRNAGPLTCFVTPQTDRPNIPPPMILVSAYVVGPVVAWPPAVFLGAIQRGQSFKPAKVTVTNNGAAPVGILAVDSGDAAIQATVTTDTPGKSFQINVNVGPMPVGWFQRPMRIRTTENDVPLEVSLSGVVMKTATTTP
jgi:hypothetical protein